VVIIADPEAYTTTTKSLKIYKMGLAGPLFKRHALLLRNEESGGENVQEIDGR
jgi:hypothetical protein